MKIQPILLYALILACNIEQPVPKKNNSQLNYGKFRKVGIGELFAVNGAASFLTNVEPHHTIYICEAGKTEFREVPRELYSENKRQIRFITRDAILTWLEALGRKELVDVSVMNSCEFTLGQGNGLVRINYTNCDPEKHLFGTAGATFLPLDGKLKFNRLTTEISLCVNDTTLQKSLEKHLYGLMLHESGHLFGLCDQYRRDYSKPLGLDAVAFSSWCDRVFSSDEPALSIMNAHARVKKGLTDDDRLGVRLIACMDSGSGAKVWGAYPELYDVYHDSEYTIQNIYKGPEINKTFADELERIRNNGVLLLPACL